jgi:hypothetical protein
VSSVSSLFQPLPKNKLLPRLGGSGGLTAVL